MRKNTFVCQLFFIGDSEGTADYVISITESWMTPTILMTLTFVVSAFIAFFTGTSWGTYAIVTPICVQMALNISGGALTPVVYATIAAVMGGGLEDALVIIVHRFLIPRFYHHLQPDLIISIM